MSAQDLVTTLGPWLAGSAGLVTGLTTLGRSFGTRRMRAAIASTSTLIDTLPKDGADEAKADLLDVLNIYTKRLLHRTQDGVLLTRWQAAGVTCAFVLILCAALAVGALYVRDLRDVQDEPIVELLVQLMLALNMITAMLAGAALFVILLGGAERWLERRTETFSVHHDTTAAEKAVVWFFTPLLWVARGCRALWAKTRWGNKRIHDAAP